MGVLWYKVWFDIWNYKTRTVLAVLSIAAGVFAIGVVFGMVDQLLSGMDAAHQAVHPSHIQMYLHDYISSDVVRGLKRAPGVEDIEPFNVVNIMYRPRAGGDLKQGMLVLREDWNNQRMDMLQLREGSWPVRNGIAIERLSSSVYGFDIGDKVTFELDDKQRTFNIVGKVRHPFVPPPQFGGQAYFFMSRDAMTHYDVPENKYSALYVTVTPYSAENARVVATDLKDRLAKDGVAVGATMYQDPSRHWGRMYVEGINMVMQILAIVSLILSVVLVYNTLTALITQQTNQIGILKAIGGRSTTIVRLYLTDVLIYGLLALFIALPLGMFAAWSVTRWFLNLFNIDYETFHFSTTAVTLQILAATAVPLLAGLAPVLGGARITVREAIASYGLGGKFGSNRFDRLIEGIGARLLPTHYATALGNMFRRKGRLILTQVVLVSAGTMFLIVMTLGSSITETMDNFFARRHYDETFYLSGRYRQNKVMNVVNADPTVADAQGVLTMSATVLKQGQRLKEAGLGTEVFGIVPGREFTEESIIAGRWLQPGDGKVLVFSKRGADKNGLALGDMVTLNLGEAGKADFQIIGLYQPLSGDVGFSTETIYTPIDALWDASKEYPRINRLIVRTTAHDEPSANTTLKNLQQGLEDQSIKVGLAQTEAENRRINEGSFSIITTMLLALATIVAVVGAIGLMGALSIAVVERTKEIGVLRAIGARSPTIMGMFVMEGVLQGLMSWGLAVLLSLVFSRPMSNLLGDTIFKLPLDYRYNWQAVGIWLAVILVLATLASIAPARSATRISVRDSLAYA
ncbi:MAG: FtsX-like permease family protein [Anaerolineae bacterium]